MNLQIAEIKNRPIFIISSVRTGSTALGTELSQNFGYEFFNEPFLMSEMLYNKVLGYFKSSYTKFVFKEHALYLNNNYSKNFLDQDAFVIRLRRKNVADQILSYYIAFLRKNNFFYTNETEFKPDNLPFDEEKLILSIQTVKRYNLAFLNIKKNIDLDLYYEDLSFTQTTTKPTPKCLNFIELKDWVFNKCEKHI